MRPFKFLLVVLALSLIIAPVSAIGVLKIELPSRAMVGEEVEIKVIDSLTNKPVKGATVYINGVEVGKTDNDGVIQYVFDSEGVYLIGAAKWGYTPAVSVSLSVEPYNLTPTPTPTETTETPEPVKTPKEEVYSGIILKENTLGELYAWYDNTGNIRKLIEKAKEKKPITPFGIFIDGQNYMILYGIEKEVTTGYYRITGYSLGTETQFDGKTWKFFEVTDIKKLEPVRVSSDEFMKEPIEYVGKEIIVSISFREISFEIKGFGTPICAGSISTTPIDPKDFTQELIEFGKEIQKSPNIDTIEKITKFTGVSTFRVCQRVAGEDSTTQAYWKAVNARIQGLVIPADIAKLTFPEKIYPFISESGVTILLKNVIIPAEKASVKEIRTNPQEYYGRIIEIEEILSVAKNISVKSLLTPVFPAVQSSPIDVYFEPNAIFTPPLPSSENVLFGFGVTGFYQNYSGIGDQISFDGKYTLKGYILSANMLNSSLPNEPILIIFERHRHLEGYTLSLEKGKEAVNLFNLLNETLFGVKAEKPVETPVKTPLTPTPSETPKETPTSAITPTPTPEETKKPISGVKLESLTLNITPDKITANPGDKINLKLHLNWEPKEWRGNADIIIILSAAGFEKKYEIPGIYLENPPIENEIKYNLPENLPPLTYTAKIIVKAGDKQAEDSVAIQVGAGKTPGFELLAGLIALAVAIRLRRQK